MANLILTLSNLAPTFTGTSVTHDLTGVVWHFSAPVTYGYYWNGDIFVYNNGGDITITRMEPDSASNRNGAMIEPHTAQSVGFRQAFDDRNTNSPSDFDASLNVDPVAASANLVVDFATYPNGASIVKAVSSATGPDPRSPIEAYSILTIVPEIPEPNAFRPGVPKASKTSPYKLSDSHTSVLKSVPPVTGQPALSTYTYLEKATQVHWTDIGLEPTRRIQPSLYHTQYGDAQLTEITNAMMALHTNLYTASEKRDLWATFIQTGLDYAANAEYGHYMEPGGGINGDHKILVVAAAVALNASAITTIAQTAARWGEDDQFRYITADDVASTHIITDLNRNPMWRNYPETSQIGDPEWFGNQFVVEADFYVPYRSINADNLPATALCVEMFGGRAAWGNEAYFDYAERAQKIFEVDNDILSPTYQPTAAWNNWVAAYYDTYSAGPTSLIKPERPRPLTLVATSGGFAITVPSGTSAFPGSSPITQVDIRYSTDASTWTTVNDTGYTHSVSGLPNSQLYFVQARFRSAAGTGPWVPNIFPQTINLDGTNNQDILDALLAASLITQSDIDNAGGGRSYVNSAAGRAEYDKILTGAPGYESVSDSLVAGTVITN